MLPSTPRLLQAHMHPTPSILAIISEDLTPHYRLESSLRLFAAVQKASRKQCTLLRVRMHVSSLGPRVRVTGPASQPHRTSGDVAGGSPPRRVRVWALIQARALPLTHKPRTASGSGAPTAAFGARTILTTTTSSSS